MRRKPYVFIGSSSEGLSIAKAIQSNLDHTCETHIWSQGLFGLGEGTLETLVSSITQFDFAILALTPDDLTVSRGAEHQCPRDNVLFELGLFIGGLGRDRVFMVLDRSARLKLPTDLAGITPATYEPPLSGNLRSALGASCTAIEDCIARVGLLRRSPVSAKWWTRQLPGGNAEDPDYYLTVGNWGPDDLPWLNVHIFPSNTFQLELWSTKPTERLMPGQYALYRFRMFSSDGRLEHWAERFADTSREELRVCVFKQNSFEQALLEDYAMGQQLFDRIHYYRRVGPPG